MLKSFRKMLKTETAVDISQALASLDLPSLHAAAEAARATRSDILVSGTEAQLVAAEAAFQKAQLEADRAEATVAELERRLVIALETERIAALSSKQADVVRERDDTVTLLERDYAKHANALAEIIQRIVKSNARIAQFNQAAQANRSGEEYYIQHGAEALT